MDYQHGSATSRELGRRYCALAHPNSGLPEFGQCKTRPKSDKSDFGWARAREATAARFGQTKPRDGRPREEPTCTCGRRGSIVCGLLFTMKIPTQACEPFASAAVNAQHRHPSLPGLTPQVGFTRLAAYNVSQLGQARVACNPSSSKKVFAKTDGPPGQARGRREPAESAGCACLLFSSCCVLLFGGHQRRETGARSSPFPVLFRRVTGKTRGGRFYPRSCFSPVIYRSRSEHVVLEAGQARVRAVIFLAALLRCAAVLLRE